MARRDKNRTGHLDPPERLSRSGMKARGAYSWSAVVMGLVAIGVGIFMILVPTLTDEVPRRNEWIMVYFGGMFDLFGTILVFNGVRGAMWKSRMSRSAGEGPWRTDYRWDVTGATDGGWGGWFKRFVGLVVIIAFIVPFHVIFLRESVGGGSRMLILPLFIFGIFDLIMLLFVGDVVYRAVRRLKFGRVRIEYTTFPYRLGQPLQVRFQAGEKLARAKAIQADLLCVQEFHEARRTSGGKTQTSIVHNCIYRLRTTFETDSTGTALIVFEPPSDVPGTDFTAEKPCYWEIEVTAELPGIDYGGVFPLPLYKV